MQSLQEQFPDMTQSVLGDVLNNYSNNTERASAALKEISEEQRREKTKKVHDLKITFPNLPEELIAKVLEDSKWNEEDALVPLFHLSEEKAREAKRLEQQEAQKQKSEEEKKKKVKEAKEKATYLLDMFHATIPKEKVQEILEENEGDIEETTTQLLQLVAKQEEEKEKKRLEDKKLLEQKRLQEEKLKKEQEKRLADLKVEVLKEKFFDLSEEEILKALNQFNWHIEKASTQLVRISFENKKRNLKALFKGFPDEVIESALQENGFDQAKAAKQLSEREKAAFVKPSQPAFNLEQSAMQIGKEVENEIHASTMSFVKNEENEQANQKEEVNALFLEDLKTILASQARSGNMPGIPGLAPPLTPKQIDSRLKKEKPVDEESQVVQSTNEVKPEPVKVFPDEVPTKKEEEDVVPHVVTLNLSSPVVDVSNPITVEWEIVSGPTPSNRDWIGLFAADKPNKEYFTYQWNAKAESKGSLTFTSPKVYGTYEFRYFSAAKPSYEHVARSSTLIVGPQYTLVATLDTLTSTIKVKWTQLSGNPYPSAWIGLYTKSQTNNNQYITWEYAAKTNNEVTFAAPIKPMEYECRLFPYSYFDVARSNVITIEGKDVLDASITPEGVLVVKTDIVSVDPYWESGWLGIYLSTENDNRQWKKYKAISQRKGEVTFRPPKVHGVYEVRLFANKTYDVIARSNPVVIQQQ